MDVKSLYNNIPNLEAIAVAKIALDKKSNKTFATKFIALLNLALILTLNNFVFSCTRFLQIKAYVMEITCAT